MPVDLTDLLNIETFALAPAQIVANRYQLLSRLVDGLAHEVKNPIHSAIINLELLRRRSDQSEFVLQRTDIIEKDLGRIHELVDALFHLLRPRADSSGRCDIDAAMGGIIPLVEAYCHVARVSLAYAPDGPTMVRIDRTDLQQILLNLIIHAVDRLRPAGGTLSLQVTRSIDNVQILIRGAGRGGEAAPGLEAGVAIDGTCAGTNYPGLAASRLLAKKACGCVQIEYPDVGAGSSILIELERAGPDALPA